MIEEVLCMSLIYREESKSSSTITSSLLDIYFIVFFICLCLENVSLISFHNFSFKLVHLISILFIPFFIKKGVISFPSSIINCLYITFGIMTLTRGLIYGFNFSIIANYIFCYYILLVISTLYKEKGYYSTILLLKKATIIVYIIVLCNLLSQINIIIDFFNNYWGGHPSIECVFGGGPNLEATWPSIFCVLFVNDGKKKWVPFVFTTFLSFVLTSRSGLIINILVLLFFLVNSSKKERFLTFALFCFLSMMAVIFFHKYLNVLMRRFFSIGEEQGSIGRINMWRHVFSAFVKNPFGYGLGNSIIAIQSASHLVFVEDNIHNLLFEFMLSFGLLGMGFYVAFFLYFLKLTFKQKNNIFLAFISIYILVGLLQFRMLGTYFFVFYSFYSVTNSNSYFENKIKNRSMLCK